MTEIEALEKIASNTGQIVGVLFIIAGLICALFLAHVLR